MRSRVNSSFHSSQKAACNIYTWWQKPSKGISKNEYLRLPPLHGVFFDHWIWARVLGMLLEMLDKHFHLPISRNAWSIHEIFNFINDYDLLTIINSKDDYFDLSLCISINNYLPGYNARLLRWCKRRISTSSRDCMALSMNYQPENKMKISSRFNI